MEEKKHLFKPYGDLIVDMNIQLHTSTHETACKDCSCEVEGNGTLHVGGVL